MTSPLPPLVTIATILVTAYAALLSQMALAVFNDGTRPFLLDFHRGELSRTQMTVIAFSLSSSFIFGFGLPVALSSGILNPWLLFLPTDILGMLSPKKWLALLLGALWGAFVIFGLSAIVVTVHSLPVNFILATQQMITPIVFIFAFFPVIATFTQFGRLRGAFTFLLSALTLVVTMQWLPQPFPASVTLISGMLVFIFFIVLRELCLRRDAREDAEVHIAHTEEIAAVGTTETIQIYAGEDEVFSLFAANAASLRKRTIYFIIMGCLLGILANTHMFAGGEATSFVLARGQYTYAAQIDFYRALGFIPLVVTTSVASGAFSLVGFSLTYCTAYLLPDPALAGIVGGLCFGLEAFNLLSIFKGLKALDSVRDASDHIRNASNLTLEVALLFGSVTAGGAMAGGLGIALVSGIYAINEGLARPIVRMAAGPAGVVLAGMLLNLLAYARLFTPIAAH
ncbi:MAG: YhfT family protein [Ktedonobacteraceae bacterium]